MNAHINSSGNNNSGNNNSGNNNSGNNNIGHVFKDFFSELDDLMAKHKEQ